MTQTLTPAAPAKPSAGLEGVVAAKSGVIGHIPAGQQWFGYPAMPGRDYLRVFAESRRRK